MNQETKESLLKLKALISANFLDLADTKDHKQKMSGCDTCGGWSETIQGSHGLSMNKISEIIDTFIEKDGVL